MKNTTDRKYRGDNSCLEQIVCLSYACPGDIYLWRKTKIRTYLISCDERADVAIEEA
jgi:hypothetical protein